MNPASPPTCFAPSQPSHPGNLGSLGNLFERLARREKELIPEETGNNPTPLRDRPAESLPNLPSRFLPDPPPSYYDRIIVGHGLPVEYRQSEDGEHYLKAGIYYFRPLNPAHPANAQRVTSGAFSKPEIQNLEF